jgi:basic membrane protein A
MKKFLAILLAVIMIVGVAACAAEQPGPTPPTEPPQPTPPAVTPEPPAPPPQPPAPPPAAIEEGEEVDIRIALVAHSPESILFDGSFNEGAHAGIQEFMAAYDIPAANFQFFQAVEANDEARIDQIESAIEEFGANVLVLPGFHFETSLFRAQEYWPEAHFILLDGVPHDGAPPDERTSRTDPNLVAVLYAEHESGFLAGYAAVMDGYREMGFTGGVPVPAVQRFGHGFIQGAEHAAADLGLDEGEVSIRFHYFGGFAPSPENVAFAQAWFAAGVEVIFAAAGGAGGSVITAAEAANAYVIGVDVDQSGASDVVVTSAMKALANSVYNLLGHYVVGTFPGGRVELFDARSNGVALPMETSRFRQFTQAQYDAIFNQLATGAVVVNDSLSFDEILADISLVSVLPT